MSQRGHSDAGTGLRRARSNSAVSEISTGLDRQNSTCSYQAQIAASEAYRRAYDIARSETGVASMKESRVKRRGSRSEGSHFDDFRQGIRVNGNKANQIERNYATKGTLSFCDGGS